MSYLSDYHIPPTKIWQEFESLCLDLWREELNDKQAQKYGRNGQNQNGVDIVATECVNSVKVLVGIQCKCINAGTVLPVETLRTEVDRARLFNPKLGKLIIANTGIKDVHLENECLSITEENNRSGSFSVSIFSWEDILSLLDKYRDVASRYFPINHHKLVLSNDAGEVGRHWHHLRYSFIREDFVHPLIIEELVGWLSDRFQTAVAVDLTSSNASNRFYGEISTKEINGKILVRHEKHEKGFFQYCHVGASASGIHVLHCQRCGGGSGIFNTLLFAVLQKDIGITSDKLETRERMLLKTIGSVSLGDRYSGELTFSGNTLTIGKDESPMKHGRRFEDVSITVE